MYVGMMLDFSLAFIRNNFLYLVYDIYIFLWLELLLHPSISIKGQGLLL